MKINLATIAVAACLVLFGKHEGYSQGTFVNLDFESVILPLDPDMNSRVPTSNALPGWTAYLSGSPTDWVLYNNISLGGSSVSLLDSSWRPIQGSYSVALQAGAGIGQIGQIANDAASLLFLSGPYSFFAVYFEGKNIPMAQFGTSGNNTIMVGDISRFAGQTGELRFVGGGFFDAVQFFNQPIPEPSTMGLFGLGALALGWFRWRNSPKRDMKRTAKSLAIIGVLFATMFRLHSQGYIVPSGVTLHPGNTVHVIQNPTNVDYTGFILRFQGASQFRFDPFVDEGVRTFLVALNDPISLQPISAGIYPELTNPNDYVFNDGVSFYLGFYTGPSWTQFPPTDPIEYADPLFGWAELVNNQGTIELLDSALAYKAQGIFAGTRNLVVPEPGTMGLFGLGALALGWFRWRKSSKRDMKRTAKSLAIMGVLLATMFRLHAQGYLVPNGIYVGHAIPSAFEVDVLQDPATGNHTGFFLFPDGKTPPSSPFINTYLFDAYLDESVRVFLVAPNQPVSLEPIMAHSYTELVLANSYVFTEGTPFYVGLYTSNYYPQNGIYPDPLFGWAELVNNQGTIELLDSALAYKAQGIYVGTRNFVVPEPSTMGLFGLGALALGWRFRRKGT